MQRSIRRNPNMRVFAHHPQRLAEIAAERAAKKKKGGPILVGKTDDGNVTVYVGRKIGSAGSPFAQEFLAEAQADYAACQAFFAATPGQPVEVVIRPLRGQTNGDGGAFHGSCDFATGGKLVLDDTATAPDPVAMLRALFIAELSECFMGAATGSAAGWNCGGSNGEGLSRFLAELVSGGASGALKDFHTADQWVKHGMPDWCSKTDPTDQDPVSTGCAVLYCWWMRHEGKMTDAIAGAGGATLQDNYAALGGQGSCYDALKAAVAAMPGPITSDNPFG